MDKNILEFWGQAFLTAARSQQQWEDMKRLFGQNAGTDTPMLSAVFKSLGWPDTEKMNPEEIAELTKNSINAFQEFFKAYLTMFDFVAKEEHLKVVKENEELKEKIAQLEKMNNSQQNIYPQESFEQGQGMDNLTKIMEYQTQQFQELMKQINLYYKKEKRTKKK